MAGIRTSSAIDLDLREAFWPAPEADALFAALRRELPWRQETITLFGRTSPVPRLTSWHGDPGTAYAYSGIAMDPAPWTPSLTAIKTRVEAAAGTRFNSVLANLYRDGRDGVAWHSDDEPELGPEPVIASASFGATRAFQLRAKADPSRRRTLLLPHGSLLVMRGSTQRLWRHQVPKTAKPVGERINLTFRLVARA